MPEALNIGPSMTATVRLLLLGGLLLASWWGTRVARGAGLDGQWVGNIVFNSSYARLRKGDRIGVIW